MTKDEAIQKCKDSVGLYGNIFGDFHVISFNGSYHCVAERYLHNYNYSGKIHYTEKGVANEGQLDQAMKVQLLAKCKTRKDRRKVNRAFNEGWIKKLFNEI